MSEDGMIVSKGKTNQHGGCNFCTRKAEEVYLLSSKSEHRHIQVRMCNQCVSDLQAGLIGELFSKMTNPATNACAGYPAKITTKDCVDYLVKATCTEAKDWKRVRKYKRGTSISRIFKNRRTGEWMDVVEDDGKIISSVKLSQPSVDMSKAIPDENDKNEMESSKDWSGRIVYGRAIDDVEEEEVVFYCGPETKAGYLSDQCHEDTSRKLETLFGDMVIDVQASENLHMIHLNNREDPEKVWEEVERRLKAAGAVKMKEIR